MKLKNKFFAAGIAAAIGLIFSVKGSALRNDYKYCELNKTKSAQKLIETIEYFVDMTKLIDKLASEPEFDEIIECLEKIKKEVNDAIANKDEESINLGKLFELKQKLVDLYESNTK